MLPPCDTLCKYQYPKKSEESSTCILANDQLWYSA